MSAAKTVRAWTEEVVIPTCLPAPPDKNPMFLEKRVYQGSSGRVSPLPFTDRIAEQAVDRKWQAVWIENEFLRAMVLPEIGGRIHLLQDKTNGYALIYRQEVIKPALVGLAGPWISGGIEFNWPPLCRRITASRRDSKKSRSSGRAMRANPRDARAHFHLGNLLYDRRRHEEAICLWERGARLDPDFATVWRNLGIGYCNICRHAGMARRIYDKAFRVNRSDARVLYEHDQLWKRLGESPAKRLRELERYPGLIRQRDDLSVELCALCHQTAAQYDLECADLSALSRGAPQPATSRCLTKAVTSHRTPKPCRTIVWEGIATRSIG